MTLYAFVRLFVKVTLKLYFGRIRIEGLENVPKKGPLLIIPNHQNALLDALLVGAFTPRSIYYLTRSDVFIGWVKKFLHAIHMIPVYRIRDGYGTLSQNTQVFDACKHLFASDEAILIFPEGNHGEHYFLRPLTKGAARLAVQALEHPENTELQVLPVGLNFFNHRAPRSTVLLKFGQPFPALPYLKSYQENPAKGLIGLRQAMSEGMKKTLVIPEKTSDYESKRSAVFQSKHESLSFAELQGLEAHSAASENTRKPRIWAQLLNPIPYLGLHRILQRTDDVVFHATIKYGFGVSIFPLWWLSVFAFASITVGYSIASLTVFLMIFGLFYSYQQ